jgi:hypothetical protein
MPYRFYSFIFLCFFSLSLTAQNNTSPYSILGVGDIETGFYGKWSGMGNAQVALSSNRYINQSNPASYSRLDDQFFNFEISGRYRNTSYASSSIASANTSSADISMKKVALGLKITKKWGTGVGIMPFSISNYSFYSGKTIQGTNLQTTVYNKGSGALTQAYWANSFSINKHISAGIQTAFLFGSLEQDEALANDLSSNQIVTTRNIFLHSPYVTYGLQYKGNLNKKWQLALGGTYSNKTSLGAEYSLHVTEGTTDLISEEVVKSDNFNLPRTYTAGAAIIYNNALTFSTDYRNQNWSTLQYKGLNYALVNSGRYSAGFEYAKNLNYFNTRVERVFYQAGFFYNNSYLQLNQEQLKDYGITLGIGGNSKRNSMGYQLSVEVGSRGTLDKGLIKENYSQVTFTLAYRDFWFTKGRKYE